MTAPRRRSARGSMIGVAAFVALSGPLAAAHGGLLSSKSKAERTAYRSAPVRVPGGAP